MLTLWKSYQSLNIYLITRNFNTKNFNSKKLKFFVLVHYVLQLLLAFLLFTRSFRPLRPTLFQNALFAESLENKLCPLDATLLSFFLYRTGELYILLKFRITLQVGIHNYICIPQRSAVCIQNPNVKHSVHQTDANAFCHKSVFHSVFLSANYGVPVVCNVHSLYYTMFT